jgi:L-Ala-D/L-Glu epimerase / N-acetyl-D-glutamate racemase
MEGPDALDILARLQQLSDFAAGNTTIKSVPLYQFLGGTKHTVETDITIGIASPESAAKKRWPLNNWAPRY